MKRLTVNQVAKANLKHNRKAYFSLAIGIFLAVYLACTAVLCIYGTLEAKEEQMALRMGWADTVLTNSNHITDDQLRSSGLFEEVGNIYVTAAIENEAVYIGYYDETAEKLMHRQCIEGRMPKEAGEIAAERSALDKLGLDTAAPGDTFNWTLQPFSGVAEERSYTLVGILSEQSVYLSSNSWSQAVEGTNEFPAVLTVPQDPAFAVGNAVVQRVMTNRPLVTLTQVQYYQGGMLSNAGRVSRVTGEATPYDGFDYELKAKTQQVIVWLLLGCALLLSTCVAIASAMESMLAQKRADIAMIRAVGATQRQVRRLYGRDTCILTLTALPAGVLLGLGSCWMISRMTPEQMLFRPVWWLLVPVVGISFLCVFLSSALPLRRASRQMPMDGLQQRAILQKAGHFRSRKVFHAARLIASRQFRLYPTRHVGSACMVALMLLCSIFMCEIGFQIDWSGFHNKEAFYLSSNTTPPIEYEPFVMQQTSFQGLSVNDLNQLRALPEVSRVDTFFNTKVVLRIQGDTPEYFKMYTLPTEQSGNNIASFSGNALTGTTWYLEADDSAIAADFPNEFIFQNARKTYAQMGALQRTVQVDEMLVSIPVSIGTLDADTLSECLADGNIDIAALDAGKEILVFAPNICVKKTADGSVRTVNHFFDQELVPQEWDVVLQNDFFHVGQELQMLQLYGKTPFYLSNNSNEKTFERYYGEMEKTNFTVTVGGILKQRVQIGNTLPFGVCLITTEKGAQALGLRFNGAEAVNISLYEEPDALVEERLEKDITRIAMRQNMTVDNSLQNWRDRKAYQTQMLGLFAGMMLLFLVVSVSMQITNASRRIAADERMIGTLRAVGANEQALLSCYRLPVVLTAVFGFVLAAIAYFLMYFLWPGTLPQYHPWLVGAVVILAVLNTVCAMAGIRSQLHRVIRKSVVENIREL